MKTTKPQTLKLYKKNSYAGELIRTPSGCQIVFDDVFKKENLHLTFNIDTKNEIYTLNGINLPPYFAGLLPEGLRLKQLIKQSKTSADDLFTLLVEAGTDAIGDIHFTKQNNLKSEPIPLNFSQIKSQLELGLDPSENMLAGVQNKASLDRVTLPITQTKKNKSYILKLGSNEFQDLVTNEFYTMSLAKKCGLAVAKTQVIQDQNNEKSLLVERFDRTWSKNKKTWELHHQEDACQFLDVYPADKYHLTLQQVAEGIQKFSTSPQIDILNLIKLYAFSYLAGNGDLHAKNISLIEYQDLKSCQLSPCYDLICTAAYGDDKMAVQVLGKNQNIKFKTLVDFGELYDIPAIATEKMLQQLTKLFQKNYTLLFQSEILLKKEKHLELLFTERMNHLKK